MKAARKPQALRNRPKHHHIITRTHILPQFLSLQEPLPHSQLYIKHATVNLPHLSLRSRPFLLLSPPHPQTIKEEAQSFGSKQHHHEDREAETLFILSLLQKNFGDSLLSWKLLHGNLLTNCSVQGKAFS